MRKYPLQGLLNLREIRLDEARRRTAVQRQKVQMAAEQLKNKEQELEDFRLHKDEKIEAIYSQLLGEVVTQNKLQQEMKNIVAINAHELHLLAEVEKAQKNLINEKKVLEQTKSVEKAANLDYIKLCKHCEFWNYTEKLISERKSESELEEFQVKTLKN